MTTTPPQPVPVPPVAASLSSLARKLPSARTSSPLPESSPSPSQPALQQHPPASAALEMNSFHLPTSSSASTPPSGGAGYITVNDPHNNLAIPPPPPHPSVSTSQPDYRNSAAQPSPVLNLYNDSNNQLARINRSNQNQLMRMGYGGVPSQDLGFPAHLGMMGQGAGSMVSPYQTMQQVEGMDQLGPEVQEKIAKMRKKRASIPPFVMKLSNFVNDPNTDNLIRWSPSGNSFLVLDEDEFARTLIPDLFKHNNYASFVRQLNMYGFHKVVGLADGSLKTSEQRTKPPSEYENPYFKRGQPDLMWLIQKPKSKQKRSKKGVKQEEADSDQEGNASDGHADGEVGGGGYIEGPKADGHDGHHSGGGGRGGASRPDIQALMSQLDAVRNHQAMISAAINRLRKDHQQLYEQSVAFQTLHQKHENSINAILQFLASVYDKSVSSNLAGAFGNLFGTTHQVQQGHTLPRPPHGGQVMDAINNSIVPTTSPMSRQNSQIRAPARRRPLLLEGVPRFLEEGFQDKPGSEAPSMEPIIKQRNSPPQAYTPHVQELFTPNTHTTQSPTSSPQPTEGLQLPQQQQSQTTYPPATTSPVQYSPIFSLPDSPSVLANRSSRGNTPGTTNTPSPFVAHGLDLTPLPQSGHALAAHQEQLAQKTREIEDLEKLQGVQDENVNNLMNMISSFANGGSSSPTTSALANGMATADGEGLENYLDWDFGLGENGTVNGGTDDYGAHPGQDMDELDNFIGSLGAAPAESVLTDPSTVAQSPAGSSTGSRAREEIDEEVEEVQPKRRKLG